ncbi:SwmB domain-containing protein [Candidatus Palauibacter irciniicola]|uniref:SwmB domain-containing protein n=1 Tax=Candidatus Palauibacter irciniicola TaxID=3056733 RepID=UPI003B014443
MCDSEGSIATIHGTATGGEGSIPSGETHTYTKFGYRDEDPALTAGTDYWVRWVGYGSNHPWVHIRTTGGGSVSLALNSAGTDSTYHNGDAIEVTATFGENVTVTGTPQISMTIGSNTRTADYSSGSGGTDLVFSYTVVTADVDNDGIEIAADALALNGGTIKTTVGDTAAAIDHPAVSASTAHKVDGRDAAVSTIEFINKPSGNYVTIGDSIEVKVTFDRPVTVTGTPRVELSPELFDLENRYADYDSGTGSTALVFKYTLQDGDDSQGSNVKVEENALELNGGTIKTGTEAAHIPHTATADAGKTVSAHRPIFNSGRIVVSAGPSVDADLNGDADTYVLNDTISVIVAFDQPIDVDRMGDDANVQIVLTIGTTHHALTYAAAHGDTAIRFSADTVVANDRDDDGITLQRQSVTNNVIRLSGNATIKGTAANGANDARLTVGSTADPKLSWKKSNTVTIGSLNVRGNNQAPTTADFTVTTEEDTDYTFSTTDFTYSDTAKPTGQPTYAAENDPLKEIQITRLPAGTAGTLKLDGTAIPSSALPKTVSKSDITKLVFDPATSSSGSGSFDFTVLDSFGAASDTAAATITVEAPPPPVLISNIDQSAVFSTPLNLTDTAQPFTTGSNMEGYTLTSIEVKFGSSAPSGVSVKLATGVSASSAGTTVATLTNPSTLTAGNNTFTAPAGTTLSRSTTYFVIVEGSSGELRRTSSTAEDDGGAAGWSVGDLRRQRSASSTGGFTLVVNPAMIRVNGSEAVSGPAVSISGGSAVTEGTAATFTLTIAEAPTTDVTVNLTVSEKAGSDFVAAANEGATTATIAMGNTKDTVTVATVGDSKDEPNGYVKVAVGSGTGYSVGSPAADSVTVNDDDTNNVATGAPAITGFPQVGQTLTAGTSGIADTDGLTSVSYSYQWIRTDSGTDTDIASATNSTYELTQADSAKTVKVKVTFQDDIGHDETLTSAASGTVQAAAPACDTGNAWCGTLTVAQGTGGTNMRSRGYCNGISARCNTAYGNLDDTDFDLGGTTFVVKSVRWGGPSSSQVRLHLTLDQDFPSTSLSTLKLKVNGHEFALSDAAQLPAAVSNNYRWDSNATIRAYEVGREVTVQVIQDPRPTLSLNDAGTDNTYHNGDSIQVTATWPQQVTVTGTPRIPIRVGSNNRNANYVRGSPGTAMVFSYVVGNNDTDADGIQIAENALTLPGGATIRYSDNTNAEIKHAAVAASTDHKVDGGRARLSTVEFINKPTGNYVTIGDSIEVKITWDRPVTVTGTPRITLSPDFGAGDPQVTRYAFYRSGSGTTALVFAYVLQDGDDSGSTNVSVAANTLSLPGGATIRTGTANATLAHTLTDSGKTVSAKRPKINSIVVAVGPSVDADLNGDADTYVANDTISVIVGLDQAIDVDRMGANANVKIALTIGTSHHELAYAAAHGDTAIRFSARTVATGDADDNGITLQRDASGNAVRLSSSATIKGTAANGANPADLTRDADPKVEWIKSSTVTVTSLNVRGTNATPTATNFTVATPTDTDRTFAVGDFTFSDANSDPLKEIEIISLPTSAQGTLVQEGTALASADLPRTLSRADIAANKLWFSPTTGFEGEATFTFKVVDAFGAKSTAAATATVKVGANVALSFNAAGDDGTYGLGDHIDITATFASSVTVNVSGGRPRIPFTLGSTPLKHATYQSGSPGTAIVFRYTVASGDLDTDGITVAANALELNGGTIRVGTTTTAAALDHDAVAANTARKVDGVKPTVSSVTISSMAGTDQTYAIGDAILLKATFSEAVTVTSSGGSTPTWPRIGFQLGSATKQAVYASGTGTTEIVFSYTVAAGDADGNGINVPANRLGLNGGAIVDAAGNAATLSHTAVAPNSNHKVDGGRPTVNSVRVATSAGTDNTYATGDTIALTVRFTENVTVASSGGATPTWPRIALTVGTTEKYAVYRRGSGTRDIRFHYVVEAGDADADGVSVAANKLELNGGTIVDNVGNAATLTHTALANQANHKVDASAPTVSSIAVTSRAGDDQTYAIGDHIVLQVTFSEAVTVTSDGSATGTPYIPIIVGTTERKAFYNSGSGNATISFRYTVVAHATNVDTDGITVAANTLTVNDDGAIKDAVGNDATLTHTAIAANAAHKVDGVKPTVSGTAGIVLVGSEVRITFTEALQTALPAASAFSVKLDNVAQTLHATTPVAISGSTVTLTLASAPGTGTLTVDYTQPTGTATKLRDAAGNAVTTFTGTVSRIATPSKATLVGTQLDITFSRALGSLPPGALSGAFTVKLGTTTQALRGSSPISISGSVLSLVLNAAPAAGSVTVSYEKPTTGRLVDNAGQEVDSFTDFAVARPATLSSATTNAAGTRVTLTFNKNVSAPGNVAFSAFTVSAGGTDQNPTVIFTSANSRDVTLSLGTAIIARDAVTVSYSKPSGSKLTDADGLEVESFSGQSVSNIVPTVVESAETNAAGTNVFVTFTASLKQVSVASSVFTVTVDGTAHTPTSGGYLSGSLLLNLGTAITAGQTVTVSYEKPTTGNKLTDTRDREIDSFSNQSVNNAVPATVSSIVIISDPGPDKTYQAGDTIRAAVRFNADVTVTTVGTPVTGPRLKFKFRASHPSGILNPPHLVYESGTGTDSLVFFYVVSSANDSGTEGIGVPANVLDPNGGAIKTGTTSVTLTHTALAHDVNHRVNGPGGNRDTTAPALHGTTVPTVNGTSLVITFNEVLDGTGTAPAASAFTVKVGGTEVALADSNPVAVSGSTVTLTLAAAVIDADVVTVAYDKPASNPIQDFRAGNDAASFGDQAVTNNTPNVAPTVLTDPAPVVGGTRLVITFSEPLTEGASATPDTSAFDVVVAGNARKVDAVAVSGSTVTLTLASAAVFGEAVTVSYTQPTGASAAKLQDRAPTPNLVASFSSVTVRNDDSTAPTYSSAAVDGAALVITFNENIDATSEPAASSFAVLVNSVPRTVTDVDISDADVTLTLASAVDPGERVSVRYSAPATNPLQDGATNQVVSFGPETATNNTRAAVVGAPSITSSPAPGDTYQLGEQITVTVTFTDNVTVNKSGGTPRIALEVGSNTRYTTATTGSGLTELEFYYSVVAADLDADGISIAANALELNGATITDQGGGAAILTHDALAAQSGHKVDGSQSRIAVHIVATGSTTVTEGAPARFELHANPHPSADLTVNLTVSQAGNFVAAANLGAKTVTIPASGSTAGEVVYEVPTVNDQTDEPNGSVTVKLAAGTGYRVSPTSDSARVTVNDNDAAAPPPPTRPSFSRGSVNGTALAIAFSRNLDAGSAPAGSAFTVTATPAGGSARTIAGTGTASISGSTVTVTLASAVASGETVRVSYARPATNPLRGAGSSGQEVSNFTGRTVANNTPSGPQSPPPQGGRVSEGGAKVTLNFADELDAASTPDPADFTVTVAAASDAASGAGSPAADDHYRVTAVAILGATVELTIAPAIPEDREASVSYTPGTRPLRTAAGAAVPNFSVTVSAAAPPPPPPPPPVPNRAPEFDVSEYAFELREHVDGSAQPVALGAVTAEDPDGDALSYALAAGDPSRFAVESGNGAVLYVGPGEDYETEPNVFELTVEASDPAGLTADASVTVKIVNVVELPVAADDTVATDEDVALEIDVLANDTDSEGAGLRVASVSEPEQGRAEIAADGGAVLYTPAENWYGTDRFTYVMEDGNGATSEASVEVTVRSVNDLPEAAADTASTDEDVAVEVAVLANDTDVDGDSLRVASVSAPENGTSAIAADGRGVLYTPDANWHGTDRFTYTADDGNGGTASASVEVTVRPVNDVPTAVDDEASTNEDEAVTVNVLANDTDPDGDGLRLVSVSAPENGTARIAANVVLYMPAANFHGTDRFTYEVEDDGGARASAAVTVTVLPTNDAPMPVGTIPAQSLEEGGDPARIELSPFFLDADGDVLAFGTVSSDSSVVRATVAGSVLTLVPTGYGRVVVVIAARDAGGLTATQAVAVSVSDGAARGMVSHALAGMARSHLASARMTLGRRPMASRSDASRLSLMGRDVPLSLNAAKSAAEQRWQGWLSGITSRAMSYARVDSAGGSGSGSGDDPTLGDLFRFGDLVGDLTRFEGGRDPLRGSEFQFGFDVGGSPGRRRRWRPAPAALGPGRRPDLPRRPLRRRQLRRRAEDRLRRRGHVARQPVHARRGGRAQRGHRRLEHGRDERRAPDPARRRPPLPAVDQRRDLDLGHGRRRPGRRGQRAPRERPRGDERPRPAHGPRRTAPAPRRGRRLLTRPARRRGLGRTPDRDRQRDPRRPDRRRGPGALRRRAVPADPARRPHPQPLRRGPRPPRRRRRPARHRPRTRRRPQGPSRLPAPRRPGPHARRPLRHRLRGAGLQRHPQPRQPGRHRPVPLRLPPLGRPRRGRRRRPLAGPGLQPLRRRPRRRVVPCRPLPPALHPAPHSPRRPRPRPMGRRRPRRLRHPDPRQPPPHLVRLRQPLPHGPPLHHRPPTRLRRLPPPPQGDPATSMNWLGWPRVEHSVSSDIRIAKGTAPRPREREEGKIDVTEDQFQHLISITKDNSSKLDRIDGHLHRIDGKLEEHDGRFDRIEGRLEEHDDRIEGRLQEHDGHFAASRDDSRSTTGTSRASRDDSRSTTGTSRASRDDSRSTTGTSRASTDTSRASTDTSSGSLGTFTA